MVTDGPLITVIDPTSYLSRPCNFAPRIHSIVVCFWQSVSWRHCFLRRTCTDCTPRGVRIHRIGGDIRMLSMLQVEEPRLKEIVEVNKIFNTHYVVNDTEQTKWGKLIWVNWMHTTIAHAQFKGEGTGSAKDLITIAPYFSHHLPSLSIYIYHQLANCSNLPSTVKMKTSRVRVHRNSVYYRNSTAGGLPRGALTSSRLFPNPQPPMLEKFRAHETRVGLEGSKKTGFA